MLEKEREEEAKKLQEREAEAVAVGGRRGRGGEHAQREIRKKMSGPAPKSCYKKWRGSEPL